MLKRVRTPTLEIAFEETGTPDAPPVVLLHGFPYDVRAYDGVAPPEPPSPKFKNLRAHQLVPGVGHNLPQEAPDAFAAAVRSLLPAR